MQTFIPCPNCNLLLSPPIKASKEARLRCPLCQHEQTAGELLFGTHNQWQVIEDPGGEDIFFKFQEKHFVERTEFEQSAASGVSADPAGSFSSATPNANFNLLKPNTLAPNAEGTRDGLLNTDEEYQLIDTDAADTSSNSSVSQNKNGKELNWKQFEPISHQDFQRNRKKSGSPIRTMVQVVFGGLIALPISQLLIWHLVKKDPFDLGPKTAAYVPWIVPETFRGAAARNTTDPEVRIAERPRRNNKPIADGTLPAEPNASGSKRTRDSQTKADESKAEQAQETNDDQSSATIGAGPLTTNQSLSQAIRELETALAEWEKFDEGSPDEKREIAQNYYGKLKSLAANQPNRSKTNATNPWLSKQSKLLNKITGNTRLQMVANKGAESDLKKSYASDQEQTSHGFACIVEISEAGEDQLIQSSSLPPDTAIGLSDFWNRRGVLPGRYLALGIITPTQTAADKSTQPPNVSSPKLTAKLLELREIRLD